MRSETVDALKELIAAVEGAETVPSHASPYVDWQELYASDQGGEEWLAWPIIPARRQAVIYAPAKAGKSLILLDIVASVASGKPILGQDNKAGKRHVLYLDYEMTGSDLLERLEEMGYEPADLTHLHYALLPIIPALNTPDGAKVVREMAAECEAELVVVDTLSRAVEGDVFHPTVVGDFYKWTGLCLKADGRALVRLDHEGKDASKGMIGSSMKATDVDLVWHLKRTDDGLRLTRKYTRIMWGEEEVDVAIKRDPLRHTIAPRGWAEGTGKVVELLDRLGIPDDASTRVAGSALREAGEKATNAALRDAVRRRRERVDLEDLVGGAEVCRNGLGTLYPQGGSAHLPAQEEKHALTSPAHPSAHLGTPTPSTVPSEPLSKSGTPAQDHSLARSEEPIEDLISAFFEDDD